MVSFTFWRLKYLLIININDINIFTNITEFLILPCIAHLFAQVNVMNTKVCHSDPWQVQVPIFTAAGVFATEVPHEFLSAHPQLSFLSGKGLCSMVGGSI